MPSRIEMGQEYQQCSGRGVSQLAWFFVLASYRLAIIIEGNTARACAGLGPADLGARTHERAISLCARAIREIEYGSLQELAA